MTLRCPPISCIPPFCSIYGMAAVNSESPVSFQVWSLHLFSGLHLFRCPLQSCLNACLTMLCLCIRQTCPNYLSILCLMTYVMDSGVNVSCLILILCRLSALVTSLIANRQRISKTSRDCVSCERSIHFTEPYIAIGNVSANCSLVS